MLFLIPLSLILLYSFTDEKFRRAYLKALRLVLAIGVIGSIVPIYPALAVALYGYFAYYIYKRRNFYRNLSRTHLVALVFLFGFLSDYDAVTYRIPAAYHLISGGGVNYYVGLFEPQNPGMTFVAAFLLLFDYYAKTPIGFYIYSLRLFNAASLYALLRLLQELGIDEKKFLAILFSLPVFEMYIAFKSSYADLTVGLLVIALFYSLYREPALLPIIAADLALIKYVRPFIALAIVLLVLPRKFYYAYYAIPIVAILRGDRYGFFYLALLLFALPALRPIDWKDIVNALKRREISIAYIRRIRETVLFGRIFGVYGTIGTIAHRNVLRPERMKYVSDVFLEVRSVLGPYYFYRLLELLFGPIIIGAIYFYSAAHAPIGSRRASEIESAAILAGLLQIAITYSIISRQYLYLFIALAIAFARLETFRVASIPAGVYVYFYFTTRFTGKPIYPSVILAIVFAAYFISLLEGKIKLKKRRLAALMIPIVVMPVAYHLKASDSYSQRDKLVNEEVIRLASYIREHFSPESTLVIEPGLIRGIGTYLRGYKFFNLLDPAERHGIESTMKDYKAAIERLANYDTILFILPNKYFKGPYYAFIGELYYISLVAVLLSSTVTYVAFGNLYLLVIKNPHSGIAAMGYRLGSYVLMIQKGPTLYGVDLPKLNFSAIALLIGDEVENATFYYYISLIEGGVYVKYPAKLMRFGVLRVAYLNATSSNYYPVGFSAIVDGKKYTIGNVGRGVFP